MVLALVLVLAVSVFLSGLGVAFCLVRNRENMDKIVFNYEYGDVNVTSPNYDFSPPVPIYRALRVAFESDGWNASSLCNMK
jgi:hypothetical protein